MGGLCGWSGDAAPAVPAERALERMVDALPPAEGHLGLAHIGSGSAVAVRGRPGCLDLDSQETLTAAIEGAPRWTDPALAELARERGHAAALIEAYRRHGRSCVQRVEGPFSLAVLDSKENAALLAVDRFAVHGLCYAPDGTGGLVFGTSTDSLGAHPAVGASVSDQAIFEYLYSYVSPAPGTIYREQQKLLPAQFLWFQRGEIETGFYWAVPYRTDETASFGDLAAELRDSLHQAMARALAGQDRSRPGAFLSGGLDSSVVAGLLKDATGSARTFTIGFGHGEYDESRYAHIAVRHFGADHRDFELTPDDVTSFLPRLAEAYDEPFGNSSAIPSYYCAKLAKDSGVDLMMAGDGGDEIFAGNSRYALALVFEGYARLPKVVRKALLEPLLFGLPGGRGIGLFRRARNFVRYANVPLPDRLDLHNYFDAAELSEVFEPDALRAIDPERPRRLRREVYDRAGSGSVLHRMLHLDLKETLADNDLRKVTRMCELAGVAVRFPFLDEDLVALSARVPPGLLMKPWSLRHFYKRAMRDYLPREIIAKKKHGFGMPFAEWTQQHPRLRTMAMDALTSFKRRGYLQPRFLDRMIEAHGAAERTPLVDLVWDIMMLELWFQSRRDGARTGARATVP